MGFTRKQGWRGLASAAFAAAVLALTATAPADTQSPAATASARGGTVAAGTVSCTFSISTDSVSGVRNNFSIPVTCTGGFADSITVNVSYLDLDQKPVRTENARTYFATARATATTSSANDNEKWIYVCMQAVKGGTAGGAIADSTRIVSRACNTPNRDEMWLPVSAAAWGYPGFYLLENAKAGLGSCLGVPASSRAGSVQLVLYHCNGHLDQMWGRGPEYTGS
ncbi:RICIN domain-containing protein [Streptomyces sasae]|uniref:RICIN domain-containing protein n=1 Tax=Streptomyces sasae TaxID=1266772 RepID=UPI00292F3380|nr:hypothetical protein [Streptomyces sasae]